MSNKFKVGDNVVLIELPNNPEDLQVGMLGRVTYVSDNCINVHFQNDQEGRGIYSHRLRYASKLDEILS